MSVFFSLPLLAKDVTFILYYPPGGSADSHSGVLQSLLENDGYVVKKIYTNTCYDAIRIVSNSDNAMLVTLTGDFTMRGTEICPAAKGFTLVPLTTLANNPNMLCRAPGSNIDLESLRDRQFLVGSPTSRSNIVPLKLLVENGFSNFKIIPFRGASDARMALLSGTVDLLYVAGAGQAIEEAGGKCIAASSRENWANVPFLGDIIPDSSYPEITLTTVLWGHSKNNIDFTKYLGSENYKQFLLERGLTHSGSGIGQSREELEAEINSLDNLLSLAD